MFGNTYTSPYGLNTMPTATQPYGYPMNPYQNFNTTPNPPTPQINTNKIYVNGVEDVRSKSLPASSDYIFLDNDKALLYQKVVDGTGQFEVKTFDIIPHVEQPKPTAPAVDLSQYVSKSEFDAVQQRLVNLENMLEQLTAPREKEEVIIDGNT